MTEVEHNVKTQEIASHQTQEIASLLAEADNALKSDSYDEAERLAVQVLTAIDTSSDFDAIHHAAALRLHGIVATRRGNYDESLKKLNEARAISERVNDKAGKARALSAIGVVYWSFSDYTKAIEFYSQALAIYEELGNKAGMASCLGNIGSVHENLSDYTLSLEYHSKALVIDEELGNMRGVAWHLGNIGAVYKSLCDYPRALEYNSRALAIAEERGDKSSGAVFYSTIGNVYLDLSDYAKALEFYSKALAINEELGNKAGIAQTLEGIGQVYSNISDHPRALEHFSNALAMDEELGNKARVASHLGSIGIVYTELSDNLKALECYSKALAIDEELGKKEDVAVWLGNIGSVHSQIGDHRKAQEYFLRALELCEEIGAARPRLHWLYNLGLLYFEQKYLTDDPAEAERYLKLAIADSTAVGVRHITRDASEVCCRLYKEQQRWQEALEMNELFNQLKDEINIEEVRKQESIRQQQKEIELARASAAAELKATTGLLHRVLPQSIATRIIAGEEEIADYFPTVSILFADIAGFTPISADMPAITVVRFLNFVFAQFDAIIKRHGCEKIKTIGDGYMAIAGAPTTSDDHAERLAAAALEMQLPIMLPEEIREHMPSGTELGVRIGLHTGSVVAGVIGEERFVYDIYSDAVNIAARMESHGEENKIHISNDFYRHLQNRFAMTKNSSHGLTFEKRGEMEIKGKGMMRTYFLHAEARKWDAEAQR